GAIGICANRARSLRSNFLTSAPFRRKAIAQRIWRPGLGRCMSHLSSRAHESGVRVGPQRARMYPLRTMSPATSRYEGSIGGLRPRDPYDETTVELHLGAEEMQVLNRAYEAAIAEHSADRPRVEPPPVEQSFVA